MGILGFHPCFRKIGNPLIGGFPNFLKRKDYENFFENFRKVIGNLRREITFLLLSHTFHIPQSYRKVIGKLDEKRSPTRKCNYGKVVYA